MMSAQTVVLQLRMKSAHIVALLLVQKGGK